MKRIIIYCILLICAIALPKNKIDISDLEPIQAVWMYEKDGVICLKTDTEDIGYGETVQQALEYMKYQSEGVVYLDTAEYLLVSKDTQNQILKIKPYFKRNVRVSEWSGEGTIEEAAKYMKSHKIGIKLDKWNSGAVLPLVPDVLNQDSDKKTS